MSKKLFTTIAAGVALVATPVLAQSDMAQRAAAEIQDAEELGEGNGSGVILALAAAGLIVAGIVVALSDDDEELPVSA